MKNEENDHVHCSVPVRTEYRLLHIGCMKVEDELQADLIEGRNYNGTTILDQLNQLSVLLLNESKQKCCSDEDELQVILQQREKVLLQILEHIDDELSKANKQEEDPVSIPSDTDVIKLGHSKMFCETLIQVRNTMLETKSTDNSQI